MRFVCWITKATSTYSEFVKITACLLQQWLPQHSSMLRHPHTACLFVYLTTFWICSIVANKNRNDGVLIWEGAVPLSFYVPSLYLHGPCKTNDCQRRLPIGVDAGTLPATLLLARYLSSKIFGLIYEWTQFVHQPEWAFLLEVTLCLRQSFQQNEKFLPLLMRGAQNPSYHHFIQLSACHGPRCTDVLSGLLLIALT
jgi:hypothetical protein